MKKCPTCNRRLLTREEGIANARARGVRLGRPRIIPYEMIYDLYDKGTMSQEAIGNKLGLTRGSIQHALRIRNP